MLISYNAFMVFVFFVLACAFLPFFYYLVKERKRKLWSLLIVLLLIPISMYTPTILTVTACGEYTREVMIFPTDEYERGYHSYIVNHSDQPIYLETIVYCEEENTEPKINEEDLVFILIAAGETHQWRSSGAPDYLFEEASQSIQIKEGEVKLKYRLSCDVPEWEEEEYEEVE